MNKTRNLRDYIAWRGDLSFDYEPFNALDAALFSQLSMLNLDEILIKNKKHIKMTIEAASLKLNDHCKETNYRLGLIMPEDIIYAFMEMGKAARYKDLVIGNYINEIDDVNQTQFSALTIDLDRNTRIVSFSGTDDTLIGWKENFNMLYVDTTAGQHLSCAYLEAVSRKYRHLYVCGHSKGANLALYSTLHALPKVERKIEKTFGFDGPGLTEDIELIDDFDKNIKKIVFFVPDTSIIGCLFDHYEEVKVVKANAKGLNQHDLFTWEVCLNDFCYVPERSKESLHIEAKLKDMISKMDEHTKHVFVEIGYKILTESNSSTLTEVSTELPKIVKNFMNLDSKTKNLFTKIFLELAKDKIIRETTYENIKEYFKIQKEKKAKK
ncbi:MAG: DUF2974 domain-containing protein [Bacilli bacterium]|nr:DUF2974 domain-containing protein [Bacilli bacterium]